MLAIDSYETLAKDHSSFTVNLVWLQSIAQENHGGFNSYLKLIFLKMPIVSVWSFFQNQVTNAECTLHEGVQNVVPKFHLPDFCQRLANSVLISLINRILMN